MDEKTKLNDELVAEFTQEPEPLDMTPLESIKSLVRQALGYDDLTPMDLTRHISVALRSSTGSNAIVEREEGSDILNFFAAGDYSASSLRLSIIPVQAGNGDPSPENIRPITGWTGATVTRAGKNLIPAALTIDDLYPTYPSGGKFVSSASYKSFAVPIPETAEAITWSKLQGNNTGGHISLSDEAPAVNVVCDDAVITTNRYTYSYTSPKKKYLVISVPVVIATSTEALRAFIREAQICVNIGTVKDYAEPSEGAKLSITFPTPPGTVYGGTLDVITGALTVTHAGIDLDSLSWSTRYSGSSNKTVSSNLPSAYYGYERGSMGPPFQSEVLATLQSVNGVAALNNPDDRGVGLYWLSNASSRETSIVYIVVDKNYSPSGLIIYELAAPLTYQLDPEELSTIVGENNIWADCGPVESITY